MPAAAGWPPITQAVSGNTVPSISSRESSGLGVFTGVVLGEVLQLWNAIEALPYHLIAIERGDLDWVTFLPLKLPAHQACAVPSFRQTAESRAGNVPVERNTPILGQSRGPAASFGLQGIMGQSRDECDVLCRQKESSTSQPSQVGKSGLWAQKPGADWNPSLPAGSPGSSG